MKKLISFIVLLFATSVAWAQEADSMQVVKHEGAHFAFKNVEHDFGAVPHKSKRVECRFEFTNDGSAPLVITKTLTSCTCVKVSYDKKPVMPGQKGVIVVAYEVNKKEPGVFYKVIEVYSNVPEKRTNLVIKGNAVEEGK